VDHVPTLNEYLGEIGWPAPEQWNDLMGRLTEHLDRMRTSGLTIREHIEVMLQSLEQQLDTWYNRLRAVLTPSWLAEVRQLWQLLKDAVSKAWQYIRNMLTDAPMLYRMHGDMLDGIAVQQAAQRWSADVEAYNKDNGFQYTGKAAGRLWNGPAADSYASVWPDQVKAADRLAKIAGATESNMARLLAVGIGAYVAWGMVLLQILLIIAMDYLLPRWFSPAGGGDVRTLLRLVATAEVAMTAVKYVDDQAARSMTTSVQDRTGLRKADRNWPNPLADAEFLHPVVEGGRLRIQGGPELRIP